MDKRIGKRVKVNREPAESSQLLADLFDQFYLAKTAEGRTKNTLQSYRDNFKFFMDYICIRGIGPSAQNIDGTLVRDYVIWMLQSKTRFEGHKFKSTDEQTTGLSPTSVNTRLKFLRTFFRFLKKEELVNENPLIGIKMVEEDDNGITILRKDQLRLLLSVPDQKRYSGFRDYVLINVLLDAFLRINEALSLRVQDIDFDTSLISIRAETFKKSAGQKRTHQQGNTAINK